MMNLNQSETVMSMPMDIIYTSFDYFMPTSII